MQPPPDGKWGMPEDVLAAIPDHGPDIEKNRAEARGLMCSGIEIRQDLIADEGGQQQWAERLARILSAIEQRLLVRKA